VVDLGWQREANRLLDKLDKARKEALTPPEFAFWIGQRKIKKGHYHHDYDERAEDRAGDRAFDGGG